MPLNDHDSKILALAASLAGQGSAPYRFTFRNSPDIMGIVTGTRLESNGHTVATIKIYDATQNGTTEANAAHVISINGRSEP